MIGVQDASGKAGIARVGVQDASGTADIARVSVLLPGGGDYVVFDSAASGGSLSVSVNPPAARGAEGSAADIIVSTNIVSVTATGGAEPYSYAWTQTAGTPADWSIETPLARTTRFTCVGGVPAGSTLTATFRCTITDARGRAGTVDVEAFATNYGSIF
jgi:hypothetical protein